MWGDGKKKKFQANGNDRKVGVAIFISDKIDFETKAIKIDKEGHYIKIKGWIKEENIILINICPPKRHIQIHKTTTNRHEGRNWQEYSHSRRL